MTRIKYLRQVIDEKGRPPDPARSCRIKDMPAPTNLTKLQAFLGFAIYYHVYISNMYELTILLNGFGQRNTKVRLKRLKKALTSVSSLTHFHTKLNIVIPSDASDSGIGAVILYMTMKQLRQSRMLRDL